MSQSPLARTLDALNVWGYLEEATEEHALRFRCFGPKTLRGAVPTPYVGVVIWCRGRGYHGYRALDLLGIWAVGSPGEDETITVCAGTKQLSFNSPFYDAGAYQQLVRKDYDVYYDDDGSPPQGDGLLYSRVYDKTERLAMRDALSEMVAAWVAQMSA